MYEYICMHVHTRVHPCLNTSRSVETGLVNEIKVSIVSLFFSIILCERISHVEE